MINWNRASINPVPKNYECLLLLENGNIVYQKAEYSTPVVGWVRVNLPEWIFQNKKKKGRARGEDHYKAKLTDEECELIRQLRNKYGLTYPEIAEKFNTSKSTIHDIVNRKTRQT